MNERLIQQQLQIFFQQNQTPLQSHYPGISARRLWDELQYYLQKNSGSSSLTPEERVADFLQQLLTGKPLAYITRSAYFYNGWLDLEPGIFIPRYETELLVAQAVQWLKGQVDTHPLVVVDCCCGSGAILCALLNERPIQPLHAFAIDCDTQACHWTRHNLQRVIQPQNRQWDISVLQGDRLAPFPAHLSIDLLISNPPYIPTSRRDGVHSQVDLYEPHRALYLEDQIYYDWFDYFFASAFERLRTGAHFLMEGHEESLQNLAKLAKSRGFKDIEVLPDLTGRDRFLKLYR